MFELPCWHCDHPIVFTDLMQLYTGVCCLACHTEYILRPRSATASTAVQIITGGPAAPSEITITGSVAGRDIIQQHMHAAALALTPVVPSEAPAPSSEA